MQEFLEEALEELSNSVLPGKGGDCRKETELWLVGRRRTQETGFLNLREESVSKRREWQTTLHTAEMGQGNTVVVANGRAVGYL